MHLYCRAPFVHDNLGVAYKLLAGQLSAVVLTCHPVGWPILLEGRWVHHNHVQVDQCI